MDQDYRYSEQARECDLMIIWKCDKCGRERKDYPGVNEGGLCDCGGRDRETGESYIMQP